MAYQKITDLFIATATDYNPKSEEAYTFFKIVQNKLHYAIIGHTAAELIYNRLNSEKEYEKFRVIQEQKYISSVDEFYNRYLNENSDNE